MDVKFTSCWPHRWWIWLGLTAAEPLKMAMFSPKKKLKVGALLGLMLEYFSSVLQSQNMGKKPRVSNKSKTWVWWLSIDVDSSTTLSIKQNSYKLHEMAAKCQRNSSFTFFKDFVGPACSSVKCQLLILRFVGFGCQPGFTVYASRQSLEQSCTQIGKLPLIFFSLALASQPLTQYYKWLSRLLDISILCMLLLC